MPNLFKRLKSAIQNKPYTYMDSLAKTYSRIEKAMGDEVADDSKAIASVNEGENVLYRQQGDEYKMKKPLSAFARLRRLREALPEIDICISVIKKEVSQTPVRVVPREEGESFDESHKDTLETLFDYVNPQGENFRMIIDKLVDDILTFDAGVLEKLRTIGGEFIGLDVIDGETIFPRINKYGEYDPEKAYIQRINEKPVSCFPREDIVYMMQNPQNNVRRFGFGRSPIEGVILAVHALLNAEYFNLKNFQENNIPAGLLYLGNKTKEEARGYKEFWNDETIGKNPQLKFAYSSSKGEGNTPPPQYTPFKNSNRDMQYDKYVDWLARLVLAKFGLSGMDLNIIQDVNRATADVQMQLSRSRGVQDMYSLIEEYFNREIVRGELGFMDVKVEFEKIEAGNPLDQAKIDEIYIKNAVLLPDEVRLREGKNKMSEAENALYGDEDFMAGVSTAPKEDDPDMKIENKKMREIPKLYP